MRRCFVLANATIAHPRGAADRQALHMELTSRELTDEEWTGLAESLAELMSRRVSSAVIMLGIGNDAAYDEQWKERTIPLNQVSATVQDYMRRGLVDAGLSDVFVSSAEVPFEIRLCRSSDVHFKTEDAALFAEVQRLFVAAGVWNDAADGPASQLTVDS